MNITIYHRSQKCSNYRYLYQNLLNVNLLGKNISTTNYQKRRVFIRKTFNISGIQTIKKAFNIQAQNIQQPQQMIKILQLVHLIGQELSGWEEGNIFDIFIEEINKVLQSGKKYLKRKKEKRLQVEKKQNILNPIQSFFSKPKRASMNVSTTFLTNQHKQTNQITRRNSFSTPDDKQLKSIDYGKYCPQEYLCQKIIIPYASYLLKYSAHQQLYTQQSLKNQDIWTLLNNYKSMLKVCQNFMHCLRYYFEKTLNFIVQLVELFDHDLQKTYTKLSFKMSISVNEIFTASIELNNYIQENPNQEINALILFCENYKLSEFKQIFQELAPINDGIIWMYHNKYMAKILRKLQIDKPQMISCIGQNLQPIFQILKRIQKHKKSAQKLSFLKKRKTFAEIHQTNALFLNIFDKNTVKIKGKSSIKVLQGDEKMPENKNNTRKAMNLRQNIEITKTVNLRS